MQGTIYLNGNRYWWKVKLPGCNHIQQIPLKPVGAKFATKDITVARAVAVNIWKEALGRGTGQRGTLTDLVAAYMKHCRQYYQQSKEAENILDALEFLLANTDVLYAEDFGPLKLQSLRESMIDLKLARSTINKRTGMIKRMFRWATSQMLVPVTTYQAIATVENLKAGRSKARETKRIKPVPEGDVEMVLPHLNQTGRAMVQLQLLTGMRSGELCIMRPCDIEMGGKIWLYRPSTHKEAFRGHNRIITIGPQGQKILSPFLKRKLNAYCFTPAEEMGIKRKYNVKYNATSYRRMVLYAIKKAGVPHWHPHQLRHNTATTIRKEVGREAARVILGHRNPKITDDYAELDMSLAKKVSLKLG